MSSKEIDVRDLLLLLEEHHGQARYVPRFDPMEELISCILSQHSSDAASFPAFTRLRETFPEWSSMAKADPVAIADVIRKAGLANQKSKSIIKVLGAIHDRFGEYSLDGLVAMTDKEAEAWLLSLPGVGPKTAAIVLCFALGRHSVPVDTHVSRVSKRLGIIPPKMTDAAAHVYLKERVPIGLAFRFHLALIQHGRKICQAKKPQCELCNLSQVCPEARV
ncbi:MAG: endonuclease III [Fimbriimonadaceae bacterium]|nr:endonuclease III [Fimbriimonadaceae bacterium]